jgi:hypothetical protein
MYQLGGHGAFMTGCSWVTAALCACRQGLEVSQQYSLLQHWWPLRQATGVNVFPAAMFTLSSILLCFMTGCSWGIVALCMLSRV